MRFLVVACSALILFTSCAMVKEEEEKPAAYESALVLIHSFSGDGDEHERAKALIEELQQSHPEGGYAEALEAESLSTWEVNDHGKPAEARGRVERLALKAINLNDGLALPYVSLARVQRKTSEFDAAQENIAKALALKPDSAEAIFQKASLSLDRNEPDEALALYRKFIETVDEPARKANAYYQIGKTHNQMGMVSPGEDSHASPSQYREALIKARKAFEKGLDLDPDGAWRNVNFAIWLNSTYRDYMAAEYYAERALERMDFPMARYHLAIARYLQLLARKPEMNDQRFAQDLARIWSSTRIAIPDAINFVSGSSSLANRLGFVLDEYCGVEETGAIPRKFKRFWCRPGPQEGNRSISRSGSREP